MKVSTAFLKSFNPQGAESIKYQGNHSYSGTHIRLFVSFIAFTIVTYTITTYTITTYTIRYALAS
jgi:hypothetical protein